MLTGENIIVLKLIEVVLTLSKEYLLTHQNLISNYICTFS